MSITSKRAAEVLSMAVTFNGCGRSNSDEMKEAVRAGIDALMEKAARENPKPLTIEELQQMQGEPVYVISPRRSRWYIVHSYHSPDVYGRCFMLTSYTSGKEQFLMAECGSIWKAYRHKPKEV